MIWLGFFLLVATPIGIFFAVLLDREMRGTAGSTRASFYIPVVLSLAVVGFIWELQYTSQGFINSILGHTSSDTAIDWLGNPSLNIWAVLVAASWRHVGYVMVLYLAGLKSVDPSLKEAAAIDGANERQTFFRVVFPVMEPINVVIVVITVIESLRAFDIAYIVNRGKNGLELLSTLITNNSISEASLVGFGSAIAVVLLVISLVPIVLYLTRDLRGDAAMTRARRHCRGAPRRSRSRRLALHGFLFTMALIWLFPLLWAVYTSFRPFSDTAANGYISFPSVLNIDNYVNAWNLMDLPLYFTNTMIVVIPAVILTLFLASMVAFGVSMFRWRFNLFFLMLFTAGNLLPPQVIIIPLYHLYLLLPIPHVVSDNGLLYDQYIGIILIHVVFQTGFCTFVLSNYMRTLPKELVEASLVDGASVFRIYRSVILPLCRPALAALATLQFTFIYNDFFWASPAHEVRRSGGPSPRPSTTCRASSSRTTTWRRPAR